MTAIDNLKKLGDEMDTAREKMRAESKAAFRAACSEIFDAHPKLESFSWTQYAPHFNDGEACTFSVQELCGLEYDGVTFEGYELSVRTSRYVKVGTKPVEDVWRGRRSEDVYEEQQLPAPILDGDGDDEIEIPDGFDMPGAIAAFEALAPVHGFLASNEEVAEAAFGSHVKVTVSRGGVETEEYEHD